nr:interleukin 15 [Oostethus manadensis]
MTARPVVLVPRIPCRASGTQQRVRAHLCRDRHTTQVWLCVCVLSILTTASCALTVSQSADVQQCVSSLRPSIENSDAMLYAPSMNDIHVKCHLLTLECYVKELLMVIDEEDVENTYVYCILHFNDTLHDEILTSTPVSCPPCEAHTLGNISTFLSRLNTLLEAIASQKK